MRVDRQVVVDDFSEALRRLQNGPPRNAELRKLYEVGELVINISTVAQEAGRARRLIASRKNCAYPEVRAAILAAQGKAERAPRPAETNLARTVERLRSEKKELQRQNRILATRVVQATMIAQRALERLGVEERADPMEVFMELVSPKRSTGRRRQ